NSKLDNDEPYNDELDGDEMDDEPDGGEMDDEPNNRELKYLDKNIMNVDGYDIMNIDGMMKEYEESFDILIDK
ncbi:4039_t:CDS:2, partial [Cetraspora pellucida]